MFQITLSHDKHKVAEVTLTMREMLYEYTL